MLKSGLVLLSSIVLYGVQAKAENNSEAAKDAIATYGDCGNNPKARALAKLVIEDSDQLRSYLSCNSLLSKIAQEKAEEMAMAGEVSHYGAGGFPNQRLIEGGYNLMLPDVDALYANHVEAIQGGDSRADEILSKFKNSYAHRVHLFGEHDFFLKQDEIGVGYAYNWDSPHVDYWVVYIAGQAEETSAEDK